MRLLVTGGALALAVLLAACGGAAPAATDPPDGGPTSAPTEPAPAATDPAATQAAGNGSGGFASRPCDLVSQADAETATGVTGMTSQVLTMDATAAICSWRNASAGVETYAGIYEGDAGKAQFEGMKILADQNAGAEIVDGLGGDAVYADSGAVLLVYKNGTAVQLTVRNPNLDAAAIKAAVLDLGRKVLGKL